MVTSHLLIAILSFVLFLNVVIFVIILKRKGFDELTSDDNDFIKYNIDKASLEIQKNIQNGIKMYWIAFDFLLNKKGYDGLLDEKIKEAERNFQNAIALNAQRQWSIDLKADSYIQPQQVSHFQEILMAEMKHLGFKD